MKKKSSSKSAFFNPRCLNRSCSLPARPSAGPARIYGLSRRISPGAKTKPTCAWQPHWQVGTDSYHDVSPPLRDLALLPIAPSSEHEGPENPIITSTTQAKTSPDTVVQRSKVLSRLTTNIPSPILNFDGMPFPGVAATAPHPIRKVTWD